MKLTNCNPAFKTYWPTSFEQNMVGLDFATSNLFQLYQKLKKLNPPNRNYVKKCSQNVTI